MLRMLIIGCIAGSIVCGALAIAQVQSPDAASTAAPTSITTSAPAPLEPSPGTATPTVEPPPPAPMHNETAHPGREPVIDYTSLLYVFMLATFIGLGVILRVSRLLHTPLMSLTNAISAIAVVGSIIVTGDPHHPLGIRILGAVALFASMTNIVSGFLITDRMLKMFKSPGQGGQR